MMLMQHTATIGIDLGATGLRAVELAWRDDRPVVQRWAAVDFDDEIHDWQAVDAPAISHLLRTALAENGIRGYWAGHSVSGEAVAPQYFSFPTLLPEDVAEAVRIEVEAGLPFRAEDALISYVIFPEQRAVVAADESTPAQPADEHKPEAHRTQTHGLAIAADRALVESRLAIIRRAGLEPFSVESDGTACGNAFLATSNGDEAAGTTAILNIGHCLSTLTLLNQGTILVRDIPVGGRHVTSAIAGQLKLPENDAETRKRTHWEEGPAEAPDLEQNMAEILGASMRELTDRLQDTVQYWVGEQLVPYISRVLLTGGGSQIRHLPKLLTAALGVPVKHWSPIPECSSRGDGTLAPWRYRLGVAFGLALRQFPGRGK